MGRQMTIAPTFQRPTLLAKVFGCYKITFRKTSKDKGSSKSKSTQMNLLVMENLFYDRHFSKVRGGIIVHRAALIRVANCRSMT
jgi:hypothetical protein